MNYFETLSQYIIPIPTLNQMINVYKLIGQNEMMAEQLKEKELDANMENKIGLGYYYEFIIIF